MATGSVKATIKGTGTLTPSSAISDDTVQFSRLGDLVLISGYASITSTLAGSGGNIGTVPSGYEPTESRRIVIYGKYSGTQIMANAYVRPNGKIETAAGGNTFSDTIYFLNCDYIL